MNDFTARLTAAHAAARGPRGLNLVDLATLRAAFPELTTEAFNAALYDLRRAGGGWLHTHDGRHGQPTLEQRAAAIEEDGRTFVYLALRETE